MTGEAPLRVLLWAPLGAGEHYWGQGIAAYRLARQIPMDALQFDLAHAFSAHKQYPVYRRQYRLGRLDETSSESKLWYLITASRWLQSHARNYDVIYGLSGFWYTLLPLAVCNRTVPTVIILTATYGGAFLPRPGLAGWRCRLPGLGWVKRRVSVLLAVNEDMRCRAVASGFPRERVHFVPNGVDTAAFHPVTNTVRRERRTELRWPDRLTFAMVGGLMERKGQHLAIEALGLVQRAGVDCQLVLAGPAREAAYRDSLAAQAKACAASGSVIFVDHRPDVAVLYQAADVTLLPSSMEGMPSSLLEAMASGLPVIVTDIPGIKDVARHGRDSIFVTRDAAAVAEAMTTLARDPGYRASLGAQGRAHIEDRFSSCAVARQHVDLFRALVRSRPYSFRGQVGADRG